MCILGSTGTLPEQSSVIHSIDHRPYRAEAWRVAPIPTHSEPSMSRIMHQAITAHAVTSMSDMQCMPHPPTAACFMLYRTWVHRCKLPVSCPQAGAGYLAAVRQAHRERPRGPGSHPPGRFRLLRLLDGLLCAKGFPDCRPRPQHPQAGPPGLLSHRPQPWHCTQGGAASQSLFNL